VALIEGWLVYAFVCPDRSKFNFGMGIEHRLSRYGYNFTFSHNNIALHVLDIIWTEHSTLQHVAYWEQVARNTMI
jgi:hypothetical protein